MQQEQRKTLAVPCLLFDKNQAQLAFQLNAHMKSEPKYETSNYDPAKRSCSQ